MDWCEPITPELNSASAANAETGEAVIGESHFTTTDETSSSSEGFEEPIDVNSVADREEGNYSYDFDRHSNGLGTSFPEKTSYAADCLQEQTYFDAPSALMITKVHDLAFARRYLLHKSNVAPVAAVLTWDTGFAITLNGRRTFRCSYTGCKEPFYKINSLFEHICEHTMEPPFECSVCKNLFETHGVQSAFACT